MLKLMTIAMLAVSCSGIVLGQGLCEPLEFEEIQLLIQELNLDWSASKGKVVGDNTYYRCGDVFPRGVRCGGFRLLIDGKSAPASEVCLVDEKGKSGGRSPWLTCRSIIWGPVGLRQWYGRHQTITSISGSAIRTGPR